MTRQPRHDMTADSFAEPAPGRLAFYGARLRDHAVKLPDLSHDCIAGDPLPVRCDAAGLNGMFHIEFGPGTAGPWVMDITVDTNAVPNDLHDVEGHRIRTGADIHADNQRLKTSAAAASPRRSRLALAGFHVPRSILGAD